MIPTSSSSNSNGCNNISSNCVIWQGPDISCINLCHGDTVSDVVAALATKLCEITDGITNEPDLTGFDLKCALPSGATPTTLVENLQAIVTYICSLPTDTGTPYTEPNINLCDALRYSDANGNVISSLPLSQYALLVGNKVCDILATITTIQTQLTSLGDRVTVLEGFFPLTTTEAQIIPTCVTSTVGVLTNVSVVVAALETDFCALRTATGNPAAINNTVAQQAILNGDNLLSAPTQTYSAQTGWKTSPVNMANSLQNAWIVIKDLYDAVQTIQTNCCPGACEDLTFAFSVTRNLGSNSIATSLTLGFAGAAIPAGFADTGGTTLITVTDEQTPAGTVTTNANLTSTIQSGGTVNISLSGGSPAINPAQNLTVTINSSFTQASSGAVCDETKSVVSTGELPCPVDIATSSVSSTGFTVGFTNILGNTAVYRIKLHVVSGGVTNPVAAFDSGNITSPGTTVSHAFTGLTPNVTYAIRLNVAYQGKEKVCPDVTQQTDDAAPPCNEGIDIGFLFDYTASMGGQINTAKTSVASIIADIKTASGHPTYTYRLGLGIFDEKGGTNQTPSYNTNANYTSLPAAQRDIQNGSGATQFFTAMELFQNNNETSFTTQLNKLNNASGGGMPLGNGDAIPEPGGLLVNKVINNDFLGAFRSNIAKILVIVTDAGPGGDDQLEDATDIALFNTLATQCQNAGIKVIVLGTGANNSLYSGLATATGGGVNATFNAANITTLITNLCATP